MTENKCKKKAQRKQTKAKNVLLRDTGISSSDEPTKVRGYLNNVNEVVQQ
jgi:hypothetical protein